MIIFKDTQFFGVVEKKAKINNQLPSNETKNVNVKILKDHSPVEKFKHSKV